MKPNLALNAILAVAIVLTLAACGGNQGRCGLFDKGYPLCGI